VKPWNFGAAFKDLVRRAGVTKITLHDLRDTHASLLAMAGIGLDVISERLRHSSIGITADRYLTAAQSFVRRSPICARMPLAQEIQVRQFVKRLLSPRKTRRCKHEAAGLTDASKVKENSVANFLLVYKGGGMRTGRKAKP
jgi:hypothetical protein